MEVGKACLLKDIDLFKKDHIKIAPNIQKLP